MVIRLYCVHFENYGKRDKVIVLNTLFYIMQNVDKWCVKDAKC